MNTQVAGDIHRFNGRENPFVLLRSLRTEIMAVEVKTQNPGNHDDEGNDKLQGGCENNSLLSLRQGFGSEGSLHDVLVEAPVKEIRDP